MEDKGVKRTETRERILEVSAKLFAEKGYSATGIDELDMFPYLSRLI